MSDKSITSFGHGEFLQFSKDFQPETNAGYNLGGLGSVYSKLFTDDHKISDIYVGATTPADTTNATSEYMAYSSSGKKIFFRTVSGFSGGNITSQTLAYILFT